MPLQRIHFHRSKVWTARSYTLNSATPWPMPAYNNDYSLYPPIIITAIARMVAQNGPYTGLTPTAVRMIAQCTCS